MEEHDFTAFPELTNAQLETLRFQSPHEQIEEDFDAIVMKVVDGDTVHLRWDLRAFSFPLRLHDIDAPELSEGGSEARDWLTQRVLGKRVLIQIDKKNRVDKYGRLLGRVIADGLDVAEEMIRSGLVRVFEKRHEGKIPPLEKTLGEAWA